MLLSGLSLLSTARPLLMTLFQPIRAGCRRCHYFQKQTIEKRQRNASWGKRLGGNDDVVSILQSTVFPPEIEWVIE